MKILEQLEKQKKELEKKIAQEKKRILIEQDAKIVQLVRQHHKNKYTDFETERFKLEVNSILRGMVSAKSEKM